MARTTTLSLLINLNVITLRSSLSPSAHFSLITTPHPHPSFKSQLLSSISFTLYRSRTTAHEWYRTPELTTKFSNSNPLLNLSLRNKKQNKTKKIKKIMMHQRRKTSQTKEMKKGFYLQVNLAHTL